MIRRKYAVLIAVALFVAAGSLAGCGSSSTGASSPAQTEVAKASVTIAAKFPTADGAVKSLIPAGAQAIEVYLQAVPSIYDPTKPDGTLLATLTLTEQSTTVQIAPGTYTVVARAYDSADPTARNLIGQTSSGGEIRSGQSNTIVLTFLDGQWTLVDSADKPTPLVLSNGTLLKDFIVTAGDKAAMSPTVYKAGKSSIDYSKPIGGGRGMVRLRFDNNTSAKTYGTMMSQFVGTGNSTLVSTDSYNLTQKCSFDNYYGIPCDETAGDQIVMISGTDTGNYQRGGSTMGSTLSGSAESLLPGGGRTTFTQNGAAVDLRAAMPETTVTGGTVINGGIVEWKPATDKIITLGTPTVAKMVKSALAVNAQSSNTPYTNLTIKDYETVVCSGANPQNRGSWSFANYTSAGKVVLGSRVCYTNSPNLNSQYYDPATGQYGANAGDYSYGLVPTDINTLGDYCHMWGSLSCMQPKPGPKDIYYPWNFKAAASATKTTINYGSFKLDFWKEISQTGNAYIYPFRAKGSTTVTPAQ